MDKIPPVEYVFVQARHKMETLDEAWKKIIAVLVKHESMMDLTEECFVPLKLDQTDTHYVLNVLREKGYFAHIVDHGICISYTYHVCCQYCPVDEEEGDFSD